MSETNHKIENAYHIETIRSINGPWRIQMNVVQLSPKRRTESVSFRFKKLNHPTKKKKKKKKKT